MDIAAIRAEVAAALAASTATMGLTNARVYPILATQPALPAIHVAPPSAIDYHHQSYGDGRRVTLRVVVEVDRADPIKAQRQLDRAASWPGVASVLETYTANEWTDIDVTVAGEPAGADTDDGVATLAQSYTVNIYT